jgi:AcrR family transcriptional regulator
MMTAHARREKYRKELRTEILDAARVLFIQEGYQGFSMRKLAEKVGYSHASMYLHFRNKAQLFDCLVEESFVQLRQRLKKLQQKYMEKDPVEMLKKGGRVYVEFGLENPYAYEFAFILRRKGPQQPWRPHPAFEGVRSMVRRCVEQKRFRPVDIETASQALWAAVHGVTSLLILRPSFPWVSKRALIEQVVNRAVDSLLANPPAGSGRGVRGAKSSQA